MVEIEWRNSTFSCLFSRRSAIVWRSRDVRMTVSRGIHREEIETAHMVDCPGWQRRRAGRGRSGQNNRTDTDRFDTEQIAHISSSGRRRRTGRRRVMGRRGLRKAKRVGHWPVSSFDTTDKDKRLVESTKDQTLTKQDGTAQPCWGQLVRQSQTHPVVANSPLVDPLAEAPNAVANELSEANCPPPPKPFCEAPVVHELACDGIAGMTGAPVGEAKGLAANCRRSSEALCDVADWVVWCDVLPSTSLPNRSKIGCCCWALGAADGQEKIGKIFSPGSSL